MAHDEDFHPTLARSDESHIVSIPQPIDAITEMRGGFVDDQLRRFADGPDPRSVGSIEGRADKNVIQQEAFDAGQYGLG